MFEKVISIIVACGVCIFLIRIFFEMQDLISKIIYLPFLFCGLFSFGSVLVDEFENYQLGKILSKGFIIFFLIFWFGFLIFFTFEMIKKDGNYISILFSIPFWIVGFFLIYKYLIKNN